MNYFANIDWGAFFGAEVRVIDGQDHLCIPLRFNPSIRIINRRPVSLLKIVQTSRPDAEGFTHKIFPHIPNAITHRFSAADYVKMTPVIGRAAPCGQTKPQPAPEPVLDHNTLATRAVKDEDIPL